MLVVVLVVRLLVNSCVFVCLVSGLGSCHKQSGFGLCMDSSYGSFRKRGDLKTDTYLINSSSGDLISQQGYT